MNFIDKFKNNIPTLSFEFFPPKNSKGWATLYSTLAELSHLQPDFVSVTYGAGGSTRQKTLGLVERIQSELGIETMAHLTCVGHSKNEIENILNELQNSGINNVIALRGDPPKGEKEFKPHLNGFAHASDLIKFTREKFNFNIASACYPEKHIEAPSPESDIEFLKLKQDLGSDFAITQLFFDNSDFLRFRDKARKAGIHIPIVAGIMPVTSLNQLDRFKQMAGAKIPDKLIHFLNSGTDVVELGIQYGTRQCVELLNEGIHGLHLYTLNKSNSSMNITRRLREEGFFQLEIENKKA